MMLKQKEQLKTQLGLLAPEKMENLSGEECQPLFDCGVKALEVGNVATAFLCFSGIETNSPAALFNLALCFFKAEDYEHALDWLHQARKKMENLKTTRPHKTVPILLEKTEANQCGYRFPMQNEFPVLLPVRAEQQIMRLQADILYALGRTDELEILLHVLGGKGYENIERIRNSLANNREEI